MKPNQIVNEWENLDWALGHLLSASGLFYNFSKVNEGFV